MNTYLSISRWIDFEAPNVATLAASFAENLSPEQARDHQIAERCFSFVRDEIHHCMDSGAPSGQTVTCAASEVLRQRSGFCYGKSHLLAALLRANNIPAGLCYQRLDNDKGGFTLHGFNALLLQDQGWYRLDARGGAHETQFNPPEVSLAYNTEAPGEIEYPQMWAEPAPEIVEVLSVYSSVSEAVKHLPGEIERNA